MSVKRIIIVVFALLALFLVLRKSGAYAQATMRFTNWFRKAWLALTTGRAPEA